MSDPVFDCVKNWAAQNPQQKHWVIAYSGGMDSHVLLHACHLYRQLFQTDLKLEAIHINHQLQACSQHWVSHCRKICHELAIPLSVYEVKSKPQAQQSLEAWARDARYDLIAKHRPNHACVFLAHHMDDQAETLLLQLMRGAGVKGLSCMGQQKQYLVRPFLEKRRADIETYARTHQLQWVEDPSNSDTKLLRNFIRHEIMPRLVEKVPGVRQAMLKSIQHIQEANHLLEELAKLDGATGICAQTGRLDQTHVKALTHARLKNVIRYWIGQHKQPMPPQGKLETIIQQFQAAHDSNPHIQWHQTHIRRFKQHWYIDSGNMSRPGYDIPWHGQNIIPLSNGMHLKLTPTQAEGLYLPDDANVRICCGRRGVVCKPQGHAQSKTLKKLFQENHIPPWQRPSWPQIFVEDTLVCMPGLFVREGWFGASKASRYEITLEAMAPA